MNDSDTHKIIKKLCGTILKSKFCGRARELVKSIPATKITSEIRAEEIKNTIYKRDPLSVVSDVYSDVSTLISAHRGPDNICRDVIGFIYKKKIAVCFDTSRFSVVYCRRQLADSLKCLTERWIYILCILW